MKPSASRLAGRIGLSAAALAFAVVTGSGSVTAGSNEAPAEAGGRSAVCLSLQVSDTGDARVEAAEQGQLKLLKHQYDRNMKQRELLQKDYEALQKSLIDFPVAGDLRLDDKANPKPGDAFKETARKARQWAVDFGKKSRGLQAETVRLEAAIRKIENAKIHRLEHEICRLQGKQRLPH